MARVDVHRTRTTTNQPGRGRIRGGFTLLEMMLVMVIIGLLAGVAVWNIVGQGEAARISTTQATLRSVKSMLTAYNLDNGTYPATLTSLVPKYTEAAPVDAWKRPLVYFPSSGNAAKPYTLYSTGKSGEQGGADIIDVWQIDQPKPAGN